VGNITAVAGLGGTFTGFQAGVKGFFDYSNANGGINGTKVDLISVDDGGDPGKNAAAARKLVAQDKVVAIVGQATIADAASQKYLEASKVPVIGGWAASSAWHKPASNMFVSLEGPNKPYCGLWSLDTAKAEGVKSVAFIAQDFPAATQDADCRMAAAKKVGLAVAGKRVDVALTAADYRPAMQTAIKSGADAIYFSTGADGILKGIQAGEQLGYKGDYYATQPSSLEKGLATMADKLEGRVFSAAFSLLPNDDPSVSPELAKFQKGMKQYQPEFANELTAVSGWAAAKMFADALTAVGPDKAKLTDHMSKLDAYTFGGLQGPMSYTDGSKPNKCTTRLVLKGGKFARADSAAKPPSFDCGVLIDPSTGTDNG
jgi:branched-chain amino acid transport system substrate-binding protein